VTQIREQNAASGQRKLRAIVTRRKRLDKKGDGHRGDAIKRA
jgi:hypothetical protein